MDGLNQELATWLRGGCGICQTPRRLQKVWDERVKEIKRTSGQAVLAPLAGDALGVPLIETVEGDQALD